MEVLYFDEMLEWIDSEDLYKICLKQQKEIKRLNNIIDKIELALESNINDLEEMSEMKSRVDEDKEILRFIRELRI